MTITTRSERRIGDNTRFVSLLRFVFPMIPYSSPLGSFASKGYDRARDLGD